MMRSPAERVARINAEISGVAAQYGVGSWELEFLASVAQRMGLTPKQDAKLAEIEDRVFRGEGDD